MENNANIIEPPPAAWQDQIRRVLTQAGPAIARILAPGQDVAAIDADLIKSSGRAHSFRLRLGTRTGFLKLFDPAVTGATRAFASEKRVLTQMKDTDLVAKLLAYCDQNHWLLIQDIPETGSDPAGRLEPTVFAHQVGQWIAQFEATAADARTGGNWLAYTTRLGLGPYIDQIDRARDQLSEIPLCGLVMARNDGALHNYLSAPDGRLLGCDFETARLKPRGWEYVRAWHALAHRYGDQSAAAIEALSNGFDTAHRGALIIDELNYVARILFCAQFLKHQNFQRRAA